MMGNRTFSQQVEDVFNEVVDEAVSEAVSEAVDEAVKHEREACAKVADERYNYWDTTAYNQRRAGKSDTNASIRITTAEVIAIAIRARTQKDK